MLKSWFNSRADRLATAIYDADEARVVRLLSKCSAEALQQLDAQGRSLFELAVHARQPRILQLLLQRSADPLPHAACGTPLALLAIRQPQGSLALLSVLLRAGADPNLVHEGLPLLHHCVEHCQATELMLHLSRLLEHGADINQLDQAGAHLMQRLLPTGNRPLLQFMLQSGARCESDWLESLEDPALQVQLRRTLEDMRIRQMMLGR